MRSISSRGTTLSLDQCQIMGVLNITPDSFSDGGKFRPAEATQDGSLRFEYDLDAVIAAARQMVKDGATIIDVGGESTGPGSVYVSEDEELQRVIPVVSALIENIPEIASDKVWISVDTYKPTVAAQALEIGALLINDVTALRFGGEKMAGVIAHHAAAIVLMYSKDQKPHTTREAVDYDDVVSHINAFLQQRIGFAKKHGISDSQIVMDPGMGHFISGKPQYSLEALRRLQEFKSLGYPLLIGPSKKSFIGEVLGGVPVSQRLEGTLAAVAVSVMNGAQIVRVHDVKETVRIVRMVEAIVGS